MDLGFLSQILILIVLLPVIILLIYITLKFSGKYMGNVSNGKVIKVIERVQLSQNSFLAVVVIDNKPYVISSGDKGINVLKELERDSMEKYMNNNMFNLKTIPFIDKLLTNKFRGNDNEKTL